LEIFGSLSLFQLARPKKLIKNEISALRQRERKIEIRERKEITITTDKEKQRPIYNLYVVKCEMK
jgi:hypothetical protein